MRKSMGLVSGFALTFFTCIVLQNGRLVAEPYGTSATCASWDISANEALVRLARTDGRLHELADAIFRMRRAQRSCQIGLTDLACQDYRAILSSAPRLIGSSLDGSLSCEATLSNHLDDGVIDPRLTLRELPLD
jgi:hypothetical protein